MHIKTLLLNAGMRWLCWAKATVSDTHLLFFFYSYLNILPNLMYHKMFKKLLLWDLLFILSLPIWIPPSSATQRWDAPLACLCLLLSDFGLILDHRKKVLFNVCHWQPFSFPTHPSSAGKHITHANTPTEGERDGQFEQPVLFPNL